MCNFLQHECNWTSCPVIFIRFTLNINIDSYLYVLSYLKKRREIYKGNYKRADIFIRQLGAASITKNLTSSLKEVEVVARQAVRQAAWLCLASRSRSFQKAWKTFSGLLRHRTVLRRQERRRRPLFCVSLCEANFSSRYIDTSWLNLACF